MRRLATKNATDSAIPWAWFPTEEEEDQQLIDLAEDEDEESIKGI